MAIDVPRMTGHVQSASGKFLVPPLIVLTAIVPSGRIAGRGGAKREISVAKPEIGDSLRSIRRLALSAAQMREISPPPRIQPLRRGCRVLLVMIRPFPPSILKEANSSSNFACCLLEYRHLPVFQQAALRIHYRPPPWRASGIGARATPPPGRLECSFCSEPTGDVGADLKSPTCGSRGKPDQRPPGEAAGRVGLSRAGRANASSRQTIATMPASE